jgi:thiamine-phosphate pyrophosphorylase
LAVYLKEGEQRLDGIERMLEFAVYKKVTRKADLFDTDIYCITSEEHSNGRSNIEVVSRMLDAGIKIIQYREKSKTMLEKYRQCVKLREMTAEAGAAFIINDHIDLAKSVCADGVHLGQDDMPIPAARKILGDTMIIGVSTHSPLQAEQSVKDGADYIGVGPIYRTFTKKDVCDPVGLEYLDYAVENIRIPLVAIGGIKCHNIKQVKEHGARCVALVTEIVSADDIEGTICSIRKIMRGED